MLCSIYVVFIEDQSYLVLNNRYDTFKRELVLLTIQYVYTFLYLFVSIYFSFLSIFLLRVCLPFQWFSTTPLT